MSLINQMLRDLERRKNHAKTQAQPLQINIPLAETGKKSRFWFLPLVAVALAFIWYQTQTVQLTQNPAGAADAGAAIEPAQAQPAIVESMPPLSTTTAPALEHEVVEKNSVPAVVLAEGSAAGNQALAAPAKKPRIPAALPAAPKPEKLQTARPLPPAKPASSRRQAETLYRQAQPDSSSATSRTALQEALLLDPLYLPVRTLLLQTLLKSPADRAEALTLAEDSLQLFPDNLLFIKTRALFYIQEKNFADAAGLLETIPADNIDDTGYLALLASAYQQLQRFPQALSIYQRLSQIQPEKAENWLGLAIALDKLNQPAAAAYQQALDKNTLSPVVVDYIKQRLSALN